MNLRELEAQAEFLAPVIASAVSKVVGPLREALAEKDEQIAALIKRLDEMPDFINPDLEQLAKDAAALIVLPEVKNGKDAEPVDLEQLAKDAAALIVLPEVKNGKDAEPVDLEAVAALVKLPELPVPEKIDIDAIARAAAALVPAPVVKEPEHGRDALDLEILPAIDEAKQYPRGTYAAHLGGLWRSYERTHGLKGWECIVDGIAAVNVTQDSVREFSVTLAKSSGQVEEQKFTLPAMIYKGVWRPGEAHPGDTFTFGGSLWHCDEATTDKPGESKAFTLAAKRGKDGNDAVQIKREPQGVVKL